MPAGVLIDPPLRVRGPVRVSRFTPLPALPDELAVAKVAPPPRFTVVRSRAGPPVAATVLAVPPRLSGLPVAKMPVPALGVTARFEKEVVPLLPATDRAGPDDAPLL